MKTAAEIRQAAIQIDDQGLRHVTTSLKALGLTVPAKHLKAFDQATGLRQRLAAAIPTESAVVADMEAALTAGEDPFATPTAARYATGTALLTGVVGSAIAERSRLAAIAALSTAAPDIIKVVQPVARKAGESVGEAFDLLGPDWIASGSTHLQGKALSTWAEANEALRVLENVARVWTGLNHKLHFPNFDSHRWLILATPDRDHVAAPGQRRDPLWLVRAGLPVDMATLDGLAERGALADRYTAEQAARDERARQEALTRHLNRTR